MFRIIKNLFPFNRAEISENKTLTVQKSSEKWITNPGQEGFEVRYRIKKLLYHGASRFQTIDVIEHENFGRMLFLNNDAQIAESDGQLYNDALVDPLVGKKDMRNIAILGGGDGGVLATALALKPKSVTMVEIDEEVMRVAKEFFPNFHKNAFSHKNARIVVDDVYNFLDKLQIYDAIIYDLTMHPEEFMNINREVFLDSLFAKIRRNLRKEGMLTLQCSSEFDADTLRVTHTVLHKYFTKVNFTKVFIPSFCAHWIFASAEAK
ncbi:MAG: methyltransferase [Patescibacteria group bacterium]